MSFDSSASHEKLPTLVAHEGDEEMLNQCFLTISLLLTSDTLELWARGPGGLSLHHDYKSNSSGSNTIKHIYTSDHSKNLCEMAMASLTGFYSKEIRSTKPDVPQPQTLVAFRLPRANVNTDVFVVGYASKYIKFDAAKLRLLFWLSHSLCAVAFTPHTTSFGTVGEKKPVIECPQRAMAIVALRSSPIPDRVGDEVKEDPNEGAQHIHYSKQIIVPVDDLNSPRSPPCAFSNASSFRSLKIEKDPDRSPSKLIRDDVANKSGSKLSFSSDQNSPYTEGNNLSRSDVYSCNRNTDDDNGNYSKESAVQSNSNVYYNKGGGSVCSSVGPSSNNTMGTALTSVTGAAHRLKMDRATRSPKYFDFNIIDLSLLRNINRRVDLNEMVSLEYVTDGSHSQVYSAVWNNQQVIVKILSESKANHVMAIHEFDVECELLTRLDHPNIAAILGGGVIPRPFLIIERLRDVSGLLNLAAQETNPTIFKNKTFKFIEVLHLSRDLAVALKYLHSQVHQDAMILHRDLKPENLGLDPNGRLKLFDFGLCRCVFKRANENQLYEMTGNTGSLRYMAPEVVLGQPYTEKVDVYSFAMIMWTFAKSKSPFKGFDRAMHRSRVVLNGERPKLDPDWPIEFTTLLEACWNQDDSLRPDFIEIELHLEGMIELFSKDKDRDSVSQKTTTKGLNFFKTIFTKR